MRLLPLSAFSVGEVRRYLEHDLSLTDGALAETLAATLGRHTGGNPLFVKAVGSLSARELALYVGKLPTAPEGVRWELVRTLGQASTLQPAATTILVDWYRREDAPALKVLIGQNVPASALAG